MLLAGCGSEPEQAPASGDTSGTALSRANAIDRGIAQIVTGSGGPAPAEPENAVARLMPWSVFKSWSESAPTGWIGQEYGELDPNDPVWVVQMEAGWPEGPGHEAGAFVFPIVVLDAVTGLQSYGIWSTEPFILPQDFFDPEEPLGPLQYVVEPSQISHEEAVALVLEQGRSITPDTPLRGRADYKRVTADQIRYVPFGRFWRELALQQPTDPRAARLGWLLTLPYEMRLTKHAGAPSADGTQPPRVTEWGNVIFAILDDETGVLIGGGTEHQWNAEMTQGEYSAIWDYGQRLGWWRLWDKLRDLPEYERIPPDIAGPLAAEGAVAPEPTATPVPSPLENTASYAADPGVDHVVFGRVTRKIGEVKLPDAEIPGFNLFSYWGVEVEQYVVGRTSSGEVVLVVHEGDANADGVKFRGARFPITIPLGEDVFVFLDRRPSGWPGLAQASFSVPAEPGANGLLVIRDGKLDVTRDGEQVEVTVDVFVDEVIRVGRLSNKIVGRVLPAPTPTPAPVSTALLAAGSLKAAIESLPEEAWAELAGDVMMVFPVRSGLDRMPAELDPINRTVFGIYHLPSGSWAWSRSGNFINGRTYYTLEALEAIESVLRDPGLMTDLYPRWPN
jgi:hypothetical protein